MGERTAKATVGDYVSSAFNQDSPINGAVAWYVGHGMAPDPEYDPYSEKNRQFAGDGVWPEFQQELLGAKSRNHALYIRDRLLQKQEDLTRLGDMGVTGNIGRFALGLVDPTNLALGFASGGVTSLLKGGVTVARGARMVTAAGKAADSALYAKGLETIAAAAGGESSAGAVATGLGSAAAGGYAFERLRQSVNFEDSQSDALMAGLMTTAFAAPIVGLTARQMSRVRLAAHDELRLAERMKAAQNSGGEPTAADHELAQAVDTRARAYETSEEPTPLPEQPHVVTSPEELVTMPAESRPAATKEAPAPARSMEGEGVAWHNESGEEITGTVTKELDGGNLLVEDGDGKTRRIHKDDLVGSTFNPEGTPYVQGTVGAAAREHIPGLTDDKTAMARFRFDIYAYLNKDPNPEVRALGDVLVKDAIQKSDFYAQGRTASEEKRLLQRTLGGNFHFNTSLAYHEAATKLGHGLWARHSEENIRSFHESAGRLARNEERVLDLGRNREIEPELRRAAGEYRKLMDTMLEEMQRANVKGADGVAENPAYVNRIWNVPKIKELMTSLGEGGEGHVVRLVAQAIRVAGKQGDEELAKQFLGAVMRLEHSHMSTDIALHAVDDKVLTRELTKAKLSFEEIDALKQALFEARDEQKVPSDSGNPAPLKFRFNLDETTTMDVNGRTIALADLLENDVRVLADRYLNSMAGHVGLAKKGILSRADFDARIRAADKDHEANKLSRVDDQFAQSKKILEDVYSNIVGRPMSVHSFNTGDRVASTLRGLGRMAYLGQLGFTAAYELFHAASLSTFSAAYAQMPSFRQFIQAVRHGYVPGDEFAKDLRTMTGFGTEHASSYARQHEISEFTYDKKLSTLENFSNRGSHFVDKMSGNSFFTSYSRGLAARFMTQKYADFASGKLKLDAAARKRLVGNGIDAGEIDRTLSQLQKFTERDASGRVERIRYEDWSAKDPDSYHAFTTAIQREVRTAIQDHDLGETWYFQHTAIGKIFTELRAFSIAAHSKQMLANLHYRDQRSLHLFLTGVVSQSMAYVMQTSMNYAHDQQKLKSMLTPEKIALAAYKRMSLTGILPIFTEPFLPSHLTGLTANTENRMPWITPSMMLAGKTASGISGAMKYGLYGEPFTGKEFRDSTTLVPNLYGARNLLDWSSSLFPKSETSKPTP